MAAKLSREEVVEIIEDVLHDCGVFGDDITDIARQVSKALYAEDIFDERYVDLD